jgi:hypothetical protein
MTFHTNFETALKNSAAKAACDLAGLELEHRTHESDWSNDLVMVFKGEHAERAAKFFSRWVSTAGREYRTPFFQVSAGEIKPVTGGFEMTYAYCPIGD